MGNPSQGINYQSGISRLTIYYERFETIHMSQPIKTFYHCTTKANAKKILTDNSFDTRFVYAWADIHLAIGYSHCTNKKKILFIDAKEYEKIVMDSEFIYALVKSGDILKIY